MATPAYRRADWVRVTRANRCPICDHDTWCAISEQAVLCMRVQSSKEITLKTGEPGWIHALGEGPARPIPPRVRQEHQYSIDVDGLMRKYQQQTRPSDLLALAHSLHLPASVFLELRCAYAAEHRAFAFPMRDYDGKAIGIRLRNLKGDKWAVKGSRQGLFIPYLFTESPVYLVEGPTDTAAALALGFYAIGRPSCTGGMDLVNRFLVRNGIERAVIVSDNDQELALGFRPGMRGSEMLQAHLKVSSTVLVLPDKDLRSFVNHGGTAREVEAILNTRIWRTHYDKDLHNPVSDSRGIQPHTDPGPGPSKPGEHSPGIDGSRQ